MNSYPYKSPIDSSFFDKYKGKAIKALDIYLREVNESIVRLSEALNRSGLAEIYEWSHKIKGSSKIVGATDMYALADKYMQAAEHEERQTIATLANDFHQFDQCLKEIKDFVDYNHEHMINVLLVDDHDIIAKSLNSVFEGVDDIDLDVANTGQMALDKVLETKYDVVLMDSGLPDACGAVMASVLVEKKPELKVIAFTVSSDRKVIEKFKKSGAKGYVSKYSKFENMLEAIREVHKGIEYWEDDDLIGILPFFR